MDLAYQPYFDPDFDSLIERIYPPRVSIDNDSDPECTLVKVDSANKYGILLEMVQVLADVDLVISRSYISSDGGWFMDVFHVTDRIGKKITDPSLLRYIQQALCATRRGGVPKEIQRSLKKDLRLRHVSTERTAFEVTGTDRPGLLSEISAVLFQLGCHVTAAMVWTHHDRAASLIYVEDGLRGGPIADPIQLSRVAEQLENVVDAHHVEGERRSVRLADPAVPPGWTHAERRLHELMYRDKDYESCRGCDEPGGYDHWRGCQRIHVSIETCNEKGYSVVSVRSPDRPKLLFDTVCALTELQYVVFHASVGSKELMADQEYFIRQKDGCTLNTESQKEKLTRCLIAAIERRTSQGLKIDISAQNKMGLLSDVTRTLRENGLSVLRAEISTQGDRAVGSFHVTDTAGNDVGIKTLESIVREMGGSATVVNTTSSISRTSSSAPGNKSKFSIGSLLWSQVERLSSSFASIRH